MKMEALINNLRYLEGKGYTREQSIELLKISELANISQGIETVSDQLFFMSLVDTN